MAAATGDGTARLFTVRIWAEAVDGIAERRGHVRDVARGAHRSFRTWSDLTNFLSEQLADDRTDDRIAEGEPS